MTRLRTHNRRRARKRNRQGFASRFFRDLHAAWEEEGTTAIKQAAQQNPLEFVKIVARLNPSLLLSSEAPGLSDDKLARLKAVAAKLREGA